MDNINVFQCYSTIATPKKKRKFTNVIKRQYYILKTKIYFLLWVQSVEQTVNGYSTVQITGED